VVDEEVTVGSEDDSDDENGGWLSRPSTATQKSRESEGKEGKDGEREWERVLGFPADGLGKILTPAKAFNKKRFEIGIDGLVFLGAPMFVKEDGSWKTRRRKRAKVGSNEQNGHASPLLSPTDEVAVMDAAPGVDDDVNKHVPSLDLNAQVSGFEPGYGHSEPVSAASSEAGSDARSTSTGGPDNDVTMFNVVFVLSPPALEYQVRVDEMYDNVVKRFAKSLKLSQAQSQYVSRGSRLILSIKEKAKETCAPISSLWANIIARSSLAKSIVQVYDKISASRIAHVNLNNAFDVSFQIPQAISTSSIPTATEPQMPGLWLTTATLLDEDDAESYLSPHSALLLLEDEETIIKEIESDAKALSVPLVTFIRTLKPTKSLQKLASAPSYPLSLRDLQYLARHLIYWRRARAIPPLHHNNTYVVSPNADLRNLLNAILAYQQRFPTWSSLTKMLGYLGGIPKPYSTWYPSTAHKEVYMDILAWMMRGGWVTHLRTFAWVKVPAEVKAAVDGQHRIDASNKGLPKPDTNPVDHQKVEEGREVSTPKAKRDHSPLSFRKSPESAHPDPDRIPRPSTMSLLSPQLQARRSPLRTATLERDITSPMSALMAVHPNSLPERPRTPDIPPLSAPGPVAAASNEPSASPASSMSKEETPTFKSSLVYSPHKATELESDWLNHIRDSLKDDELRELWPALIKYFDGKHALDEISLREGIKRKKVAQWISWLRENGWLVWVRHW